MRAVAIFLPTAPVPTSTTSISHRIHCTGFADQSVNQNVIVQSSLPDPHIPLFSRRFPVGHERVEIQLHTHTCLWRTMIRLLDHVCHALHTPQQLLSLYLSKFTCIYVPSHGFTHQPELLTSPSETSRKCSDPHTLHVT